MAKKHQPRRGQLALLSRDEHDVLLLDDDTKARGKVGVTGAREAMQAAIRKAAITRKEQP